VTEEEAKKLAENHWDWLEPIIDKIPFMSRDNELLGYLYKTALVHGIKHGKELGEKEV